MDDQKPHHYFTEYAVLTSGSEIPFRFAMWCSLSAISAALGRRVWIDMGPFKIYPNMFIVLVAGSGRLRKSTAVGVAENQIRSLKKRPNIISQKVTTEALISCLATSTVPKTATPNATSSTTTPSPPVISPPTIPVVANPRFISMGRPSQGFLITDELTNFLNMKTIEGGISSLLTNLYDCKDEFEYRTIARGAELIVDSQLGILSATTPEELRQAVPEATIGSGLASRLIFVYEDKPNDPVPFPTYSERQIVAKTFCIDALNRISQLSGPITLSSESKQWGDTCYRERCWGSKFFDNPQLAGYASRRFAHIMKIAINLSAGQYEGFDITPDVLTKAEAMLVSNERHLPKILTLITMSQKGSTLNSVYSLILSSKSIEHQDLLRQVSHKLDARELTDVLNTLSRAGLIYTVAHPGGRIVYTIKAGL